MSLPLIDCIVWTVRTLHYKIGNDMSDNDSTWSKKSIKLVTSCTDLSAVLISLLFMSPIRLFVPFFCWRKGCASSFFFQIFYADLILFPKLERKFPGDRDGKWFEGVAFSLKYLRYCQNSCYTYSDVAFFIICTNLK